MSSAFEGFSLLRNISDLNKLETNSGMKITNLFKDCRLLGDVSAVENWANGQFSDFTDAFTNAVEAKQVAAQNKLKAQTEQEQATMEEEARAKRAIITANAEAEQAWLQSFTPSALFT